MERFRERRRYAYKQTKRDNDRHSTGPIVSKSTMESEKIRRRGRGRGPGEGRGERGGGGREGEDYNPDLTEEENKSWKLTGGYLEIHRISSLRHLTNSATETLLCAFVLSRLDYCNAPLAVSPKYLT